MACIDLHGRQNLHIKCIDFRQIFDHLTRHWGEIAENRSIFRACSRLQYKSISEPGRMSVQVARPTTGQTETLLSKFRQGLRKADVTANLRDGLVGSTAKIVGP